MHSSTVHFPDSAKLLPYVIHGSYNFWLIRGRASNQIPRYIPKPLLCGSLSLPGLCRCSSSSASFSPNSHLSTSFFWSSVLKAFSHSLPLCTHHLLDVLHHAASLSLAVQFWGSLRSYASPIHPQHPPQCLVHRTNATTLRDLVEKLLQHRAGTLGTTSPEFLAGRETQTWA